MAQSSKMHTPSLITFNKKLQESAFLVIIIIIRYKKKVLSLFSVKLISVAVLLLFMLNKINDS